MTHVMNYIKIFILIETILLCLISYVKNPDIFSPAKFYLLFSIFFYLAIYFENVEIETLICYFFLIQAIAFCVFLEKKRSKIISPVIIKLSSIVLIIWLASIPSILIMLYFIYDAGGLFEYLLILSLRVEVWKGQGFLIMILNMLPVFNLIYFGHLISHSDTNIKHKIFFGFHFIVFFIIGLLTASRSYVGISILGMVFLWAYIIRKPSIKYLLTVSIFLIFFAGFMGALRNEYGSSISFDSLMKNIENSKFENAQMAYGTSPLEIIFTSPEKPLLWGATYLTLFTNIIPRVLWPNKPDTGGVIFTKEYTDDQTGLSYVATGAITEAILNFGISFGFVFGIIFIFTLFLSGSFLYNKYFCKNNLKKQIDLLFIISFYYFIISISKFSYGEFTDIFQTLIFFNLLPLFIIKIATKYIKK